MKNKKGQILGDLTLGKVILMVILTLFVVVMIGIYMGWGDSALNIFKAIPFI